MWHFWFQYYVETVPSQVILVLKHHMICGAQEHIAEIQVARQN